MKLRNAIALGLSLSVFLCAMQGVRTHAAETCEFEDGLKALAAVRENTGLNYLEEIRQELRIRKDLLEAVVDCATGEAQTLQANLGAVTTPDPDVQALEHEFSDQLSQVLTYYQIQRAKISDLGIQGSQDLARDISEWRTHTYKPLSEKTVNFIIWAKNQELMGLAQNRLNQIGRTVMALKLVNADEIQTLFQEAQANFRDAQIANDRAKESFSDVLHGVGAPSTPLAFVKSSLEALAKTYQNFFDLSTMVNTLLPH